MPVIGYLHVGWPQARRDQVAAFQRGLSEAGFVEDSSLRIHSRLSLSGLLRQYFPKGTDLSRFSQPYLNRMALRLNQRPRKTLGFETPADRDTSGVAVIS